MTVALDGLPCSERAEALGEDMSGTAPSERGILVIEQPGPWGRDAVKESGLRPLAAALEAHAAAAGTRIQVVRRSTRRYATGRHAVWLAGVAPGARFLERLEVADPHEILDLDLSGASEGRPTGAGTLDGGLLHLCCTHSTRDPCCARRGLPLHRALTGAGARAWHAAHLGGHRFAATMACLPLGVWLGRVPAAEARAVKGLLEAGRLPLPYLRGRAGEPPAVQAAEIAVRRAEDIDGIDDLVVERADGETVVMRAAGGRTFRTTVRRLETGQVRAVSCGTGAKREDPGRFEVTLER